MSILAREPQQLTQEDVPFCSAVGAQVGWAIINARLHAEQVRVQDDLRQSQSMVCSMLDNMADVVWSSSWPDLELRFVSPSVEALYGRPAQDYRADLSLRLRLTHPDDALSVTQAEAQLIAAGSSARESQIARQLAEKETLLTLQAASTGSEDVKAELHDAISRVRSMGELYEKLLLGDEYRDVPLQEYADARKAVSVGIILNELVTNAFRYAFVGRDGGTLSVAIDRVASTVTVTFARFERRTPAPLRQRYSRKEASQR